MNTNKIKSQNIWYCLVAGRSSSNGVIDEIWRYNCYKITNTCMHIIHIFMTVWAANKGAF